MFIHFLLPVRTETVATFILYLSIHTAIALVEFHFHELSPNVLQIIHQSIYSSI